jgi:hypothetical protein
MAKIIPFPANVLGYREFSYARLDYELHTSVLRSLMTSPLTITIWHQ